MATIQTRIKKDGTTTYRVGFRENGKLVWLPSMTHESGAKKIKRIVEDPRRGPAVARKILNAAAQTRGISLTDFMPKYLESRALRCTPGTIAGYRREAERTFLLHLGEMPVESIDRDTVRDWILWQSRQHTHRSIQARERAEARGHDLPPLEVVSPKTVRNAHSLLSSVLFYAVTEGILPSNPAHGLDTPDDDVREEKDIFTRAEWERFNEAMTPHYRPLIAAMLVTGARWGEVTALQVRDLDLAAGSIYIRRAWKKGEKGVVAGVPKSARSIRPILIPDWACHVLARQIEGRDAHDLVFTSPEGRMVHRTNFVTRHWQRALERAGITKHLTPHSLRHTFASWALMAGVAPQTVQHRLGHESLETTSKVYAHLLLDEQRRAVDAIGWEPPAALEA